jgi:hypothetical protein
VSTKSKPASKSKKRDGRKYPGFDKGVNSRTRWEYLDQDYIDKLSPKDKKYLSDFMCEWMSGNFQHDGKKMHKTGQEKRDCYNRNNARNRDVYAIKKATGYLAPIEDHAQALESSHISKDSNEDAIIELIDSTLLPEEVSNTKLLKSNKSGGKSTDNDT